ncbi:metabolite traffic protein EboE [Spongiimicrobium salis]|uniref:metabolite traffic protein EboE n=1 Tax=Spongiimicrobium salis TaxID=1667022 RepID=UPI00374CB7A1
MHLENTYHLTYCTNIHPGQNWKRTFESLKQHVPAIKKATSNDKAFGLGLRLSNTASKELNEGNNRAQFKAWLEEQQVYVFTMNGFPYGNFHNERVKDQVHAPDWTTPERLIYTKRMFEQLAFLIPEGISGGISTSPISYRHWHQGADAKKAAFVKGAEQLAEIVWQLASIEKESGKYLHLDIEPEPDGLLENSDEVVHFFTTYLLPIAVPVLMEQLGVEESQAKAKILRHITICYDICHFSLAYEAPQYTIEKFERHGIQIGKIQVSAALKILFKEGNKEAIWNSLAKFDEPTYLHQVTEKINGTVRTYNDLPVVLARKSNFSELRAHFHVPIFLEAFDELYSTQDQILNLLKYMETHKVSEHLEIETYTWEVLPTALKTDLTTSIIREINWLKEKL